jgi:hypothetical protein
MQKEQQKMQKKYMRREFCVWRGAEKYQFLFLWFSEQYFDSVNWLISEEGLGSSAVKECNTVVPLDGTFAEQQPSITVYRMPTKGNKLPFSISQTEVAIFCKFCFPFTKMASERDSPARF